jgi:hypothetical protein
LVTLGRTEEALPGEGRDAANLFCEHSAKGAIDSGAVQRYASRHTLMRILSSSATAKRGLIAARLKAAPFQSESAGSYFLTAAFFFVPKPVSTEVPMLDSICLATSA